MNPLLVAAGIWLALEGVGSMLHYYYQPIFPDHLVRIVRTIIGVYISLVTIIA